MNVKKLGVIGKEVPVEIFMHHKRIQSGEQHEMYSEKNKSTGRLLCVCLTCGIEWENE